MRRTSLVAPLLLIALGVLFLLKNLHPDLPLAQYIGRYWPYILILWGVVRIGEIVYWAAHSEPLPAHGVSGGEWLIVFFLCIVGMGIHYVHGASEGWAGGVSSPWMRWRGPWAGIQMIGERYDYPVNTERSCSRTPRIVIEDYRGDLQVTGSDADEVKITGRKSIRAVDRNIADRADRNSSFEITGDGAEMTLHLREGSGFATISSALEMTVPKGASLEAKRRDGDLRISNVQGSVEVNGRSADLDIHDIGGPVHVDANVAGDVRFKNLQKDVRLKSPRTEFSAAALPGEMSIDSANISADGLTGPVRLSARSRDARIRDFRNAIDVDLDRGDLTLEPVQAPLARMQASVHAGDVNLVLPENAGFSIKAITKSGEITNSLGVGFTVNSNGGRQTLQGATGNGPAISLDVDRGNISVRRGIGKLPAKDVTHPLETINQ